jgi:hypothetical protein
MSGEVDSWYLESPAHWVRCRIVSQTFGGIVSVMLYNEADPRPGRARKGLYGWLIDPK